MEIRKFEPEKYLKKEWIDLIRERSKNSLDASLSTEVLDLIYQERWFKLFVPESYGGLEMSLPEAVQLEEALSWLDGSLGWTVTLCAGAGWFAGFLPESFARKVFQEGKACVAGSGASTGTARKVSGGYIVDGVWKYASGASHATMFTANCRILHENGDPFTSNGNEVIRPFIFHSDEVEIQKKWKTIGMVATGSQTFEINGMFVPQNRAFEISEEAVVAALPVYNYPFLQLAEATLAANFSGMAMRFLELGKEETEKRRASRQAQHQSLLDQIFSELEENLDVVRNDFYSSLEKSWEELLDKQAIDPMVLNSVSAASRKLTKEAREAVDSLYPYCGMKAADPETELNKIWRDIHTASQHSLLLYPVIN